MTGPTRTSPPGSAGGRPATDGADVFAHRPPDPALGETAGTDHHNTDPHGTDPHGTDPHGTDHGPRAPDDGAQDDWLAFQGNRPAAVLAGAVRLPTGARRTAASTAGPRRYGPPSTQRVGTAAPVRLRAGHDRHPDASAAGWVARLPPGWPLQALLVGFPLWWALGMGNFIFPLLAVPMVLELRKMRPVRYPPLFWMWALFMLWQVLSLAMFSASPPGTHAGGTGGRLLSIALNFVNFGGVTVVLVYVGNLPVLQVPQRVIARWMGWFFLTVTAGGFLGILAPHFSFRSPVERLLPGSIANDIYIRSLVHPIAAQVQDVLGGARGRPAAPFGYTNSWGNALGILILWFVAGWIFPARGRLRLLYSLVALAALVPVVASLNRGLWLGLVCVVAFLGLRQLVRGRVEVISGAAAVLAVAVVLAALTPLPSYIGKRFQNGDSNSIRNFVAQQSIDAVKHSPVLGYGGTRHTDGSSNSIAIGKTANCAQCGDVATGSTGSLWAILFNQGIGGTVFYFGFFAASMWVYRRERTPIDEAALATLALVFVFMFFYNAVPVAPTLTMIAVAVLWRSRDQRLAAARALAGPTFRQVSVDGR